jgi:hypothetical protein
MITQIQCHINMMQVLGELDKPMQGYEPLTVFTLLLGYTDLRTESKNIRTFKNYP